MTQASDLQGITICTERAGLSAGNTTTYTTGAVTVGSIAGKFCVALSAKTNEGSPTTDFNGDAFSVVAINKGCVFVFSLNASGVLKIHQSDIEDLDASGTFKKRPSFPTIDLETYVPFAYVVIKNSSAGSDWTFGASNWAAGGITDTFTNITTLPLRPVES